VVVAADYPFLDVFWTMLVFFLWVMWFWLLFSVWGDIFRRDDISGWGKAGWLILTIVLPFLGVFVYLISQNEGMTRRNVERARAQRAHFDEYVRETAGKRSSGRHWPTRSAVATGGMQERPGHMSNVVSGAQR
jgi:hypothetical protein